MAAVTENDYVDLVRGTLKDLGRLKFQQVAQNLVDYEVFPNWFTKDKVVFDSGIGIQKSLMARLPGAAKHVGWTDTDSPAIVDLMEQISIPWRHATTNWSWKFQETLMNRGDALIYSVIKPKRAGAMIDMVELLETYAWAAPTISGGVVADNTIPYGVQYWITRGSSATPGFQAPSTSGQLKGGLDPASITPLQNWSGQYAAISKPDLIKKMRTMHRKIRFKSPVSVDDYRNGKSDRYRIYANETLISGFEDVGESQNENLGRDIASIDGVGLVFRGNPIRYIPYLDSDTKNPMYFLDNATFYPVVLKGDYLRESDPIRDPQKHDWYTVYVDLSYNYLCVDPRRNGELHTA